MRLKKNNIPFENESHLIQKENNTTPLKDQQPCDSKRK